MIKPRNYSGKESPINAPRVVYVQQTELADDIEQRISEFLQAHPDVVFLEQKEIHHDPTEPDCIALKFKIYIKPKKEMI